MPSNLSARKPIWAAGQSPLRSEPALALSSAVVSRVRRDLAPPPGGTARTAQSSVTSSTTRQRADRGALLSVSRPQGCVHSSALQAFLCTCGAHVRDGARECARMGKSEGYAQRSGSHFPSRRYLSTLRPRPRSLPASHLSSTFSSRSFPLVCLFSFRPAVVSRRFLMHRARTRS